MDQTQPSSALLPLSIPQDRVGRVILVSVRRMAAHGIRDAHATWLALDCFGTQFPRPLILLRTFMMELAHSSSRTIKLAPCCALRMTMDEGGVLTCLGTQIPGARHNDALNALRHLTANEDIGAPLSAAAAFNQALQDIGALRHA